MQHSCDSTTVGCTVWAPFGNLVLAPGGHW
jgi:hypothetical protein